jgi:hypothetical protein
MPVKHLGSKLAPARRSWYNALGDSVSYRIEVGHQLPGIVPGVSMDAVGA